VDTKFNAALKYLFSIYQKEVIVPKKLFRMMLLPSAIFFSFLARIEAQGPTVPYYYLASTELPWAECYAYMEGGSRQKIPFLPVISGRFWNAPLGTGNYSKDVAVDAPLVFIGNGVIKDNVWNCYSGRRLNYTLGDIDVAGKVVMFCPDFPDKLEETLKAEVPLTRRISEAAARKAAAVIVFSYQNEAPFLYANYEREADIPDIPVITITRNSAINIMLMDSRTEGEALIKKWLESREPAQSVELISRIKLRIRGNFDKVETKNFLIRFRAEGISKEEIKRLLEVNEKSLSFLFNCFKEDKELKWKKFFTVYFRDFDSKLFYTHHWGWGKASDEGVFMIYKGGVPDFGLAVHENMHILTDLNWGDSTSFLSEGCGKYTEALATEKDKNHLQTIHYLKENKLFPLEEMVKFQIGPAGLKTEVGYPASGSLVAFLIETYGLQAFKNVYPLEGRSPQEKEKADSWQKAFGKSLQELEKEWLNWLARKFSVEENYIQSHLLKAKKKQEVLTLAPEILDALLGRYQVSNLIVVISRENSRLFLEAPGMGKMELIPESETKFTVSAFDATITFVRDEKGESQKIIIHSAQGDMTGEKIK
jgi:hypothetical protein